MIAKLLLIKAYWLKKLKYNTSVKLKLIHIMLGTQPVIHIFCKVYSCSSRPSNIQYGTA